MGQPAARVGDMHRCPASGPNGPHEGGPIGPVGALTVNIGSLPAARVGDQAVCVGATDTILRGSSTVYIEGRPAARMGDPTLHGGQISFGLLTVNIGD